jgi:uncharacterized protein YdaU (DUF1376 family)
VCPPAFSGTVQEGDYHRDTEATAEEKKGLYLLLEEASIAVLPSIPL